MLVTLLLALHWGLAVTSSVGKSATFDEGVHVVAGYFYWAAGDFRFNPESGNLTQRWAALPLLAQDVTVPPPGYPPRRQGNVWATSRDVLYNLGNDADAMLFAARSMIALFSVALGGLVYAWSRSLFGRRGALLSLALYAWSPTILAHSRLVTADLAAALFFLLAVGAVSRLLERVTAGRLAAAGGAAAGLVLTKMSWLLVLPMAAVLVAARLFQPAPWTASFGRGSLAARSVGRRLALAAVAGAVVTVLVVALIWTAYGWRFHAAGDADAGGTFLHSWESRLEGAGGAAPAIRWARDHRLLPEAFLWGLAYTLQTTQGRGAFLNGEYSTTGWWTFFPYAFLYKTPLPFLGLLMLAGAAWLTGRGGGRASTLPLWVLAGLYGAASIASPLNLGHRHLLPVYAVLFILAGRAAGWLSGPGRRTAGIAVVVLLGLFAVDSWRIRPHYLSYFNALAGGPEKGYEHLVGSSIDWGQDLPALAEWLERNRSPEPVYVAYLGTAIPAYYGIDARWLFSYFPLDVPDPPLPLEGGTYCVSATLMQTVETPRLGPWTDAYEDEYQTRRREMIAFWGRYRDPSARRELMGERSAAEWTALFAAYNELRSIRLFHFLQRRPPDARAGYSLLIFRLSDDEARRATEGPPPQDGG